MLKYGVALKNKYKREMEYVLISIQDFQKKLDGKIIEIDDVRLAMEALQNFRDVETNLELRIPPVEEAFYVVAKFNIPATSEELEEADSLSYMFRKLRYTANRMSENVFLLHPNFEKQLLESLENFKEECEVFCSSYMTEGPMVPGLSPREASDKLAYFQVK
jgi:dynein heavy chain